MRWVHVQGRSDPPTISRRSCLLDIDDDDLDPARNAFGAAGISLALLAIAVAVFQYALQPETLVEDGGWLSRLFSKDETASGPGVVQLIYMSLGLLAVVAGILSWLRKENHRMAGTAMSLGFLAIGWQYIMLTVAVIVVVYIVVMILGTFLVS